MQYQVSDFRERGMNLSCNPQVLFLQPNLNVGPDHSLTLCGVPTLLPPILDMHGYIFLI